MKTKEEIADGILEEIDKQERKLDNLSKAMQAKRDEAFDEYGNNNVADREQWGKDLRTMSAEWNSALERSSALHWVYTTFFYVP